MNHLHRLGDLKTTADLTIQQWIQQAESGGISWTEVGERLLGMQSPSAVLDRPDLDRSRRCGFGEVIFGENKSPQTIVGIARKLVDGGLAEVLVTRVLRQNLGLIVSHFPYSRYDSLGRTLRLSDRPIEEVHWRASHFRQDLPQQSESVVVVTAGSTDLPVAREAIETLRWMGVGVGLLTDVGVAGPYRLLPHLDRLRKCRVLVVCAGMEGALASVAGGLVGCPIIAVPTSIGYGSNLSGLTTLLSMISSCAAGVTVVNIDAGFKGGYVAGLIATGASRAMQFPVD